MAFNVSPVSYTHLDVYKRQTVHRGLRVGINSTDPGPCLRKTVRVRSFLIHGVLLSLIHILFFRKDLLHAPPLPAAISPELLLLLQIFSPADLKSPSRKFPYNLFHS